MKKYLQPIFEEFEPLSDAEIENIEETANIKLPNSYRKFLAEFGRCMFSTYATVQTGSQKLSLFTWLGGRGKAGSILDDLEGHPDYKEQNLLPIADTEFNDRFLLNGTNGEILYKEYSHGICKTLKLASSFDKFIDNIKFEEYE